MSSMGVFIRGGATYDKVAVIHRGGGQWVLFVDTWSRLLGVGELQARLLMLLPPEEVYEKWKGVENAG